MEKAPLSYQLSTLLEKVNKCLTYRFLTCMEKDLNKVGLMIARTNGGRLILCRAKDSKPCIDKIFEDFIYLTESEKIDESISDKALNVITEFIEKSHGGPVIPKDKPRSWQHGPLFYGGVNIPMELLERVLQEYADEQNI